MGHRDWLRSSQYLLLFPHSDIVASAEETVRVKVSNPNKGDGVFVAFPNCAADVAG